MAYWLMKSEPETWSWSQQKKEGAKGAEWDGVRNFQARNNMRSMKKGELAFFYHSGEEKQAVGIVKVVKEAHPDSTDPCGKWKCVDVAAIRDLPRPVTLSEIKATPSLKSMVLVRNSRLSVQPVTESEWRKVCAMGGLADPPHELSAATLRPEVKSRGTRLRRGQP
jgi:predicted RNA-binding protein with PUA-like domain